MGTEWYVDAVNRTRLGKYLTAVEMEIIHRFLNAEEAIRSILDVGGGSGRFALPLARQGYHVTITEVEWAPLRALRSRDPAARALLTERDGWPVQRHSVDCVLAMEIPVVYDDWFWKECSRIVRPGGLVITNIVNQASYKGWLYRFRPLLRPFLDERGRRWADRPMYHHTAAAIVCRLQDYGFKLDQAVGFNWLPFSRGSESPLISGLARLERFLGLSRFAFQSPWVLFKARRQPEALPVS